MSKFIKKNVKYMLAVIITFLLGTVTGYLYSGKNQITVSDDTMKKIMLMQEYVDYGIEQYCEAYGIANNYKCNILDDELVLVHSISADKYLKVDVPIDIIKGLENEKYFYQVAGTETDLYVLVDTYRMKIFVYDGKTAIVDAYKYNDTFDSEAFENDHELEDCVDSDWDDIEVYEYWAYMRDKMEHIIIPEDKEYYFELYGEVAYVLERYCEEHQIDEIFYFDADEDCVANVTNMVYTVKVESENRILYMDIDGRRYKYHVYEVEANSES